MEEDIGEMPKGIMVFFKLLLAVIAAGVLIGIFYLMFFSR